MWSGALPPTADEQRTRKAFERLSSRLKSSLRLRTDPIEFRQNGSGAIEVRAVGIAGTISFGGITFDVAPKFVPHHEAAKTWSASMLLLMEHSLRRHIAFTRAAKVAAVRHSVVDLLAVAFIDAVQSGLADQRIQVYRTREEALPTLRGRLNLSRQVRSVFARPHLVECDVDQLDADNEFNSLLKWAAGELSKTVRLPSLKSTLIDLTARLPGTPNKSILNRGSQRISPPPQFRVWNEAIELASLVASGLTHINTRGQRDGFSFVFNMERLFERFVERRLRGAVASLGGDFSSRPQLSTPYAEPVDSTSDRRFFSKPDNVVFRDERPFAIVDAKYKRLSDAQGLRDQKPVNGDIYELIAAMTAQQCSLGLLVYPKVRGDEILTDDRLKVWQVNAFGKKLIVGAIAVDISQLHQRDDLRVVDKALADALMSLSTFSNK